jgi:hypothetical protein
MTNTNLYIKTSQPSLYKNRTTYADYEVTIFAESVVPVDKKTSAIDLKVACKMVSDSITVPFSVIPSDNLCTIPIRFSISPVFINKPDYAVIRIYVDNSCGTTYNIDYGTPIGKITFSEKFNIIIS